jgi:hypothetical protein
MPKKISEIISMGTRPFYNGAYFVKYLVDDKPFWSFAKGEEVSDNLYQEILFTVENYILVKDIEEKFLVIDSEENLLLFEDEDGGLIPAIFDNFIKRNAGNLLFEKDGILVVVNVQKKKIFVDPFEEGKIKNRNFTVREVSISLMERNGIVAVISQNGEIKKFEKGEKREINVSF